MLAKAIRNGVITADEACRRITKIQSDPPLFPLRYLAVGYGVLAFFTVLPLFFPVTVETRVDTITKCPYFFGGSMLDAVIAFPLGWLVGAMDIFGSSNALSNMSSFFAAMIVSFCAMIIRNLFGADICTVFR